MSLQKISILKGTSLTAMKIGESILVHQLAQLEWLIQADIGCRGIHRIPTDNLCTRTQGNLAKAIRFLVEHPGCQVGIATGFFIPNATPPAPENDGPPGALFLARGLNLLGYQVLLISDRFAMQSLGPGFNLYADQLHNCELVEFPLQQPRHNDATQDRIAHPKSNGMMEDLRAFFSHHDQLACLIAIERVGPSHTVESFIRQHGSPDQRDIDWFIANGAGERQGEPMTMNGFPIGAYTAPIHVLFERKDCAKRPIFTIGIGDGGNEIGMGSIPWQLIVANIAAEHAGKFACRVATDATIVAGVSNWAAYALIAGLFLSLNRVADYLQLFDQAAETRLIEVYFQSESAVDGKLGCPGMSVDGIPWELHLKIYNLIKAIVTYYR